MGEVIYCTGYYRNILDSGAIWPPEWLANNQIDEIHDVGKMW